MASGEIKVELFDAASGNKVYEAKDHNFISKGVQQLYREQMRNIFTRNRVTGGTYIDYYDPFHTMSLTTADHLEDPAREWMIDGEQIGYAHSTDTYAGSSKLRGSYNASESFTKANQVHMVFDFPTHAANGTFKSIYFHTQFGLTYSKHYFYETGMLGYKVMKAGDFYYTSDRNSIRKYDNYYNLVEKRDVYHYDFTIIDSDLYYVNGQKRLYKLPLESFLTYEVKYIEGFEDNIYGITYDPKTKQIYASVALGENYVIIDPFNGFVKLGLHSNTMAPAKYPLNLIDGFIFAGQYVSVRKGSEGHKINIVGDFNENYIFYGNYFQGSILLVPKIFIGSRCLLDAPVTKTANTTMKITYDFMLPDLYAPL